VEKKKSKETAPILEQEKQQEEPNEATKLPRLEYIGQFMGTYLLAQNEDGLYMIDQHAAAERIRYERYKKIFGEVEVKSTELLIPITLNLSNSEVLALEEHLDQLPPLGIQVVANQYNGIDITHVPTWFPPDYERIYTEEIVKHLLNGNDVSVASARNQLAINLSCKHSIKANKFIDRNEVTVLLRDLAQCENPYTCPHGRPVIIHFTQTEIEKMFKRIQS
jgi:DNA mismatch repair protein MutL